MKKSIRTSSTGSDRVPILMELGLHVNQKHHTDILEGGFGCGRAHSRHGAEEVVEGPLKRTEASITVVDRHHHSHPHPILRCARAHRIAATTNSGRLHCSFFRPNSQVWRYKARLAFNVLTMVLVSLWVENFGHVADHALCIYQ